MSASVEDFLHGVGNKMKRVLFGVLFFGWSMGWLTIGAIGYAADIAWMLQSGLSVFGGSVLALLGNRWWQRRKLKQLAEVSLLAKAQLEGVTVDRETETVLKLFDLAFNNVRTQLAEPTFHAAQLDLSIETDMTRARDHLYKLTKVEAKLRSDLKKLGGMKAISAVDDASTSFGEQLEQINKEANAIASDAHRLSERVSEVRKLIGDGETVEETRSQLRGALRELDETAAAYREIDDTSIEATERRIQQLRARHAQRS